MIEYGRWFRDRPRLRKYVRSVEVWFPVWAERVVTGDPPGQNPDDTHFGPHDHSFYLMPRTALISLQTLFSHIRAYHPHLAILALEGGSCKNGQLIRHFSEDGAFPWLNELYALYPRQLPTLPSVQTLIMRGSFNLARTWPQWHTLAAAFPNLQHWDCTYWPFGTHVYNLMREALKYPPEKLRHLTLSFDGLCGLGELSEVRDKSLCKKLARLAARLESLTFTGRICARFFTYLAVAYPSDVQEQRLRALNFNVETTCNDCRKVKEDPFVANPPVSGINNPDFICDFEAVTLGAITALKHVRTLQHLMIRTLTVNSRWVLLAPYFEFNGYRCKGFWSELIVESLASLRGGGITYLELSEGIERKVNKKGETVGYVPPTCRPVSLNKEAYKLLKS